MSPPASQPQVTDAVALADELACYRLIETDQLNRLVSEFPGGNAAAFAEFLVSRGCLTPFQAQFALQGQARMLGLGPYRVSERVGRGLLGPVYRAYRPDRPGLTYRLCVFPLRSLWRVREVKSLARRLARSPHRAVVPLVEVDTANGYHYLAWPFVEGSTLAERLATGPPPTAEEVIVWLVHLTEALETYSSHGVCHGVLSPQSIVIAADGLPRLLDLGVGCILAGDCQAGEALLDTLTTASAWSELLAFLAPEFMTETSASPAADQYALGAVAYYALTGRPPYPTEQLPLTLAAKFGPEAPPPLDQVNPTVPAVLAAVIGRMLRPTPRERFADWGEVRGQLASLLSASPTRPVADMPPPTTAEPGFVALSAPYPEAALSPSSPESSVFAAPIVGAIPERDDTDDSVTFELPPDTTEEVPPDLPVARELPVPDSMAPAEPTGRPVRPVRREYLAGTPLTPAALGHPPAAQRGAPGGPSRVAPVCELEPVPGGGAKPNPADSSASPGPAPDTTGPPPTQSVFLRKLKRKVLFWRGPADVVRVSVYGPAIAEPSGTVRLFVCLHTPETTENVQTLSQAFQHDCELLGQGDVAHEVERNSRLAVHLALTHALPSRPMQSLTWRGQPVRLIYDLHIPWEAPDGETPGLISVGRDNIRIGKIPFMLRLLPRKT